MEDPEGHSISELFRPVELASFRRLNPGNPPGLDSFFPELETQRATVPYLCCASTLKSSRDSSTSVSNQSAHCFCRSRQSFGKGGRP